MIKIAIVGGAGRMGKRIAALATENDQFDVMASFEMAGHPDLGKDIGQLAGVGSFGLPLSEELPEGQWPDIVIDFSLPEGTMKWLPIFRQKGIPMVIGTTGLTESQQAEIVDAAGEVAILQAGNFSTGITLLTTLLTEAAKVLGADYDVDVEETHHRFKQDAPSGTAIMLAKAVCEGRGVEYGEVAVLGRGGHQPRQEGEIGMHALRLGDTVGEHSVHFGALGETVTFSHSAHTRDTFVRGALRAAAWLAGKRPGLYDMHDVLGL